MIKDFTHTLDVFFSFLTWTFQLFDRFVTFIDRAISPEVMVGFHAHLDPKRTYGVATLQTDRGREQRSFTVDRPENLDEPPYATIYSIFEQIKRMGYHATEIEIRTAREMRIYRNGVSKPLFVQPL